MRARSAGAAVRPLRGGGLARWAAALVAAGLAALALARLDGLEAGLTVTRGHVGTTPVAVWRLEGAPPAPVVVVAHGFAGSQPLMRAYAATLARNGYVAVTFDFLGHGRHPDPMAGDVTAVDGATVGILGQLREVADWARALPGTDGRLALLGHSMAGDILVRLALADPAVAATVAISTYSLEVTPQAPRNLLMIVGGYEAGLTDWALATARAAHGADMAEGETRGDFAAGSARRAVFADGVEHIGVLYSREAMAETAAWLDAVFARRGPGWADARGAWVLTLIGALVALGWPLAALLPRTPPPAPAGRVALDGRAPGSPQAQAAVAGLAGTAPSAPAAAGPLAAEPGPGAAGHGRAGAGTPRAAAAETAGASLRVTATPVAEGAASPTCGPAAAASPAVAPLAVAPLAVAPVAGPPGAPAMAGPDWAGADAPRGASGGPDWAGPVDAGAPGAAGAGRRPAPAADPAPAQDGAAGQGAGLRGWRFAAAALGPALATPLILAPLDLRFLPLVVGDYLAVHFALYGVLTALALAALGARRPSVRAVAAAAPAAALVAAYGLGGLGAALDAYVSTFFPVAVRLPLILALLAGALPFTLADEWLTRGPGAPRGAYALTKLAFLASLALAVALNLERLFFLIILAPALGLFFVVFGLFSRWAAGATGAPWAGALANGLIFAWAVAVTFPMATG